ncbi:MAG TPA: hypothetical protein VN657_05910 [Nitrospiraceae bacterium]|jgi:hypothetical protein|nr:hypothetical protein [Nitrospiraceae bacterium]
MAAKTILLLAMLLGAPSLATIVAASPEEMEKDSYVVTGTLIELDLTKASGKIKTDLEQTVAFTLTRPDMFKELSVGKRIVVRLNEKGQVIKVMEMTIPELPSIEK